MFCFKLSLVLLLWLPCFPGRHTTEQSTNRVIGETTQVFKQLSGLVNRSDRVRRPLSHCVIFCHLSILSIHGELQFIEYINFDYFNC